MSNRIREKGLIFLNGINRTFQAPRVLLQRGGAFLDRAQDLWPLIYTGCTVASFFDSPLSNLVVVF
jgi:hypothetical protein